MKEKLIVIGNGMSALRTVEEILTHNKEKYEITIFGEEPHVNYNRIMLSYLLSGEKTFEDTIINHEHWYEENSIILYKNNKVLYVDTQKKKVICSFNQEYAYDKLIIATGSKPFIPPTQGSNLNNVIGFRTKKDVDTILQTLSNDKTA
ncbi:MAG: FAD-dependent oxidoreductase, partial [Arcobacteraceae bacterium]